MSPEFNYLALIGLPNLVDEYSISFFAIDVCTDKIYIPVQSGWRTIPYETVPVEVKEESLDSSVTVRKMISTRCSPTPRDGRNYTKEGQPKVKPKLSMMEGIKSRLEMARETERS